jgi:O-glycosyl hydrolase
MTMWRNELYPNIPVTAVKPSSGQPHWGKQKPVVQGLVKTAKELGVDLKIILTIWTPPKEYKDNNAYEYGKLKPTSYTDFANWLISGLDMYKDELGVDVYALSFQNESDFDEPYNSCTYTEQEYVDALDKIEPLIHAKYPKVKLFGAEHMVGMEAPGERGPFYSTAVMNQGGKLDVFAVHGYSNGVVAEAVSGAARLWSGYRESITRNGAHKPIWMTETSGYVQNWLNGSWGNFGPGTPGAFILGQMIGLALKEGRISAWVYWAWADESRGQPHALSYRAEKNKKYYVSKHFYRYIRPGAKMVGVTCDDKDLLVIPFSHKEEKRFTCMVLNSSNDRKKIRLYDGNALGASFMMYQTTSDDQINCVATTLNAANPRVIVVPPMSVVTLVNSNY